MTRLCMKDICVLLCGSIKLLRVVWKSNMVERCVRVMRSQKAGLCWLLMVPQPQARSTACSVILLLDC